MATIKVKKTAWIPIWLCWLVYTSAYLGRYSYVSNITQIIDDFGLNHADAGLVTTFFFFAYGIGQIVNGIMCKYYNKRLVIAFSLIISAVINLVIYSGIEFSYIKYLWLFNGVSQSVLWPTLISVLSENLKSQDLAKSVVIMSTSVASGTFIAYGTSSLFSVSGNYEYSFLVATIIMSITAIVWFSSYSKVYHGGYKKQQEATLEKSRHKADLSLIFLILILAVFAAVCNLVKDGVTTWMPSILKEKFALQDSLSILLTLILPVIGFFGAIVNTFIQRRVKSYIAISGIWYIITAALIGIVMILLKTRLLILLMIAFGCVSLFTHAINGIVTSIAPLYLRDKINSGLLAGLLNGACYVGSTISSYGLGLMVDRMGWDITFKFLLVLCLCAFLIALVVEVVNFYIRNCNNLKEQERLTVNK